MEAEIATVKRKPEKAEEGEEETPEIAVAQLQVNLFVSGFSR